MLYSQFLHVVKDRRITAMIVKRKTKVGKCVSTLFQVCLNGRVEHVIAVLLHVSLENNGSYGCGVQAIHASDTYMFQHWCRSTRNPNQQRKKWRPFRRVVVARDRVADQMARPFGSQSSKIRQSW